ncbi:MAG: alpha/beta hydrolase [Desulfobacteraceae bacterium]
MKSKILAAVLRQLRAAPDFTREGIEKYREFLDTSAKAFKIDRTAGFKPVHINGVPGAWIIPARAAKKSVVLYLHGGGFIAGSIASHRDLATRIANASESKALIIDYRLAPEHPFPAGLEDAVQVYTWLLNHGFSAPHIAIAGDSAGGGLAVSLLLTIRDKGLPMPGCAALISPWTDLECKTPSHTTNQTTDPMLNQHMLFSTAQLYTEEKNWRHPLVSPANGDFQGLCPLLVQVGSKEILQDDAVLLVQKAKEAGVPAEIEIWEGMFHVWHYFSRYLDQGRKAVEKIGSFIKAHSQQLP